MDDFIEKIPNWIRYILALPAGIVCLIIFYYIGYFANLYIASPDSWCIKFYTFFYNNGINVLIMMGVMNYILPNYQFKFTLVISVIFFALGFIGLGMNILIQNITVTYILGLVLTVIAFIYCCYCAYDIEIRNKK